MADDAALPHSRSRLIVVYGLAHFGKSLFWNTSSLIFAFFLTEMVGLKPEVMGYVLAVSLFFNAVADFTVGATLSRWVQSAASAAKAQFLGGLLAALAFMAFCAAGFVPQDSQLVYAFITILLFRLGYSVYDVPQNAFMAFASFDDRQRATLASTRYISAGASILLIALAFAPIVREADPGRQATQFLQLAIILAVISGLCSGLLLMFARRGAFAYSHAGTRLPDETNQPSGDIYPLILASIFALSFCSPVFTKLEAYFTAFVLDEPLSATVFMACVAGGKVAAQPAWAAFANATSLTNTLRTAALTWGLAAGLFFLTGRLEPWGTILSALVFGASSGGVFMALWSLLARSAAIDPAVTTRRFGLFTFFSKSAQALSILALGQALSLFAYDEASGKPVLTALMAIAPLIGAVLLVLTATWMTFQLRTGHSQRC